MTKAEQATAVVRWLESGGLTVNPSPRVGRMRGVNARPDGTPAPYIGPEHPEFETALEGERDLQMLNFAREQLGNLPIEGEFRRRLKRMLADPTLPQDDLQQSAGRDIQCELYVASICTKARMSPVFNEPDILCNYLGKPWGIAVKRCKGYGGFEDRIRGAVDQIQRTKRNGIVVADISVMLNPTNERIVQPLTDEEFGAAARFILQKFSEDHRDRIVRWFRNTSARGLILVDHHVRLHPAEGWELSTISQGINLGPGFKHFYRQYMRGLPTPATW